MDAGSYINLVNTAFQNANDNVSKLTEELIYMDGLDGVRARHFYNNLLNTEDARYLEIGTWKGSSVCSAMYENAASSVVCINNWAGSFGIKAEFLENWERFRGQNNATYIDGDCFAGDVSVLPKSNIYLYAGDLTNSQNALTYYYDCLDNVFIFIMNNWNYANVREATMNSISSLNLTVVYELELRTTWDNSFTLQPELGDTWWNGMYVVILQKPAPV